MSAIQPENQALLSQLIPKIRVAMMSTVQSDGRVHSRPMATIHYDAEGGELWFFTDLSSSKAVELQEDPRVQLSYCDPVESHYASVSGQAELVRDPGMIRRFWRPEFVSWSPEGLADPDLVLIQVTIERVECWSEPTQLPRVGLNEVSGSAA